jgi:hypothetical protein
MPWRLSWLRSSRLSSVKYGAEPAGSLAVYVRHHWRHWRARYEHDVDRPRNMAKTVTVE